MLAALYRANEDAFLDANMNRLRAGGTLAIPDSAAVAAIAPDEAKRLVAAHREALQAMQAALKRAPAPGTGADRLEVSRAEGPKPGAAAAGDDVASLQHSAREANERIVLLEKTVAGLQKIVELQNRQLARLREAQLLAAGASRPGDAVASDLVPLVPRPAEPALGRALARAMSDHWAWLATVLLLAFTTWVWMPLKTARLWRKKRRRRDRLARRAARRTHRRRVRVRVVEPAAAPASPPRAGTRRRRSAVADVAQSAEHLVHVVSRHRKAGGKGEVRGAEAHARLARDAVVGHVLRRLQVLLPRLPRLRRGERRHEPQHRVRPPLEQRA
jgi:FimV-like protein